MRTIVRRLRNNHGATAIEYGLIVALIAVAVITSMQGVGLGLQNTFNNGSNNVKAS